MLTTRSRLSLTQPHSSRLVVRSRPARRLLYLAVGLVLAVGFVAGGGIPGAFEPGARIGTGFYLLITATSLGVAAFNAQLEVDTKAGTLSRRRKFLGWTVAAQSYSLAAVRAVILRRIVIFRGSGDRADSHQRNGQGDQPEALGRPVPKSSEFEGMPGRASFARGFGGRGLGMRRRELAKLYVDVGGERRLFLDDSSDPWELTNLGEQLAQFLGVDYRSEEV